MTEKERQEVVTENWLSDLNTSTEYTDPTSFFPLYNAARILLGDIPLIATADSLVYQQTRRTEISEKPDSLCGSRFTSQNHVT